MKTKLYLPLILLLLNVTLLIAQQHNSILCNTLPAGTTGQPLRDLPTSISEDWYGHAVEKINQMEYAFINRNVNHEYQCYNSKSQSDFYIDRDGFSVRKYHSNTNWNTQLKLLAITKGTRNWDPKSFISCDQQPASLRFIYEHFDVEYLNNESGMRQNFIVKEKPTGNQKLRVKLSAGKQAAYELLNNKLYCYEGKVSAHALRLIYDDLKVWDATGKLLNAQMELDKNNLSIIVDDENAAYPVTIDPLSHSPEWTTSANGVLTTILTTGQLQIDALYGFKVAGLGDVNGDGYDDIAIGAPGAINILAGPSTIVGAGAVFVYFGSATGPSTTPDKVLRSNTPVANALFGYSIAAGNVTGNTRNDIIIGAPGDSYSTAVSGFPATATVTAGKVYVFKGEDMSLSSPSPLLSIFLKGSAYFSRGIIGVLGSNISINALFGFSVAVADDMTGDGLGEIAVGSPGYAELGLLPVSSGAALVYYSGNLATNTAVKLTAPSSGLLDIALINNQGLLFGFSVDGAGDFNQDGKPDIIVGAPAGITLSPGNLLGGTAYIYKGTGTGVSTTHLSQLKAAPSLIGSVTNLFGFTVKGVRNANGNRNGNVLVGAPSGNLLSNLLNGLKLKSGSVNVFKSKSIVLPEEIPVQSIQSSRGSSLLSILAGQNLDLGLLFGASIDNMLDVNCDGIGDIIIGEPLSTSVGIISANLVGGGAAIFTGKPDGTYNTSPYWTLANNVSFNAGVNAGSLLGYSVAGAGHVRGMMQGVRCLIGAPGAALDFSSGIFNLGNTVGTMFSFAAGNNGLGKSYMFGFGNCNVIYTPDINVTYVNVPVPGNVHTNDVVPVGSTYGVPVPSGSNPSGGSINMQPDGSYIFTSTNPGVFIYYVPVCLPGEPMPCTPVELTITVLTSGINTNPPVANTDIASTMMNTPVTLKSLSNDKCYNIGCTLIAGSVQVTAAPKNGTTMVDLTTGDITYTPASGFVGRDTLTYSVCDNAAKCATAKQIITVYRSGGANTTLAADDYVNTYENASVSGNVKTNDTDPEHDQQTVVAQTTTAPGQGSLVLNTDGSFSFLPVHGFTGPVEFPYTTCDNGSPSACANATLYILVIPMGTPLPVKMNSFSCAQKNCAVQLSWTITQDNSLMGYSVENSVNGIDWEEIGTIEAKANAGTSDYDFIHNDPVKGENYYRIVMTDRQGLRAYSNIQKANVSCSNVEIVVNPNPFTDHLIAYFTSEKTETISVDLYDNAGKNVASMSYTTKIGSNQVKLKNLNKLAAGVYVIRIKTSTKTLNQKLVK